IACHALIYGGHGADVTASAQHSKEFLLEFRDMRSLDQLFLITALRDDLRDFRDHPHAEPADRSHRFVSLLIKNSNRYHTRHGERDQGEGVRRYLSCLFDSAVLL